MLPTVWRQLTTLGTNSLPSRAIGAKSKPGITELSGSEQMFPRPNEDTIASTTGLLPCLSHKKSEDRQKRRGKCGTEKMGGLEAIFGCDQVTPGERLPHRLNPPQVKK